MSVGNIAAAQPTGVLPKMTFTSFRESRVFPMLSQGQHDGTVIRSLIVDGVNPVISIKSWDLSARLKPTALATLKTFFESHAGGKAFYFYAPDEVVSGHAIGSNYDASGNSAQGRYTVKFANTQWQHTVGVSRCDVSFTLQQVA